MPTPPKPAKVLQMEKKSHRTKKEIAARKKAEAELLTGKKIKEMPEVMENEIAHKEFTRVKKLLEAIEKNDDLYGSIINRYCMLKAESEMFAKARDRAYNTLAEIQENRAELIRNSSLKDVINMEIDLQKTITSTDRQIQAKRKMMMDIEKENVMTIASSLRSIPKKAEKKSNPLKEALSNG